MKTVSLLVFLSLASCGMEEKPKKSDLKTEAVNGADGAPGKDGADGQNGADGKDGAAGAGVLGVYAGKQMIGYYLGGKEVELISGALAYLDFSTGVALGTPWTNPEHTRDTAETIYNICYYESNDCTGTCWVQALNGGGRPQPGYIFTEGQTVWRIDGDERLVENLLFSSARGVEVKCHYTSAPGSMPAIAMEHKEELPAGLTVPFGKLTIGKVK